VFSIEFIHLFVLAAILRRFGEEGCLWFLLFQEEVERKAEVLEKKIFLFWGHVKHKIKLA